MKLIVKLDLHDDKAKQKALKVVSGLSGIDLISIDMKEKKLTVVGDVDPVDIVSKLRKLWHTEIISVGPAKEPEKPKEAPNKDEKMTDLFKAYEYNPYMARPYYSMEDNPNTCVIC